MVKGCMIYFVEFSTI